MTKKLFYGIVITISLFGGMNIVSAANKTVIDPEQWCDPEGVFEDPPIDEIINNGYNDYTTTTNQYCKQYCSEKVVTNFPTTVPTITVDQIIQSGGHFVWNPIQFTGTKTCYTKFDYTTWLNDYNEIIGYVGKGSSTGSGMLYSYWKWQQELHQRDSVEDTGKCVVNGKDCKKVNLWEKQYFMRQVFIHLIMQLPQCVYQMVVHGPIVHVGLKKQHTILVKITEPMLILNYQESLM